ncbi:MAG: YceI family protein [Nitrospirota bacterium]
MATWIIDPDHSVAAFSIRHMMISNVHGQFNRISGVIDFDPADIPHASVEVSIDVSGIYTGIQKRDDHLRSPDFFDVATYPVMTFKSRTVETTGGNRFRVIGDLTIKEVTRTVSFDVEYSDVVISPMGGESSRGFVSSLMLNCDDFGITWNVPLEGGLVIGRNVQIELDVEADLEESL